jgi:hypothetical protein
MNASRSLITISDHPSSRVGYPTGPDSTRLEGPVATASIPRMIHPRRKASRASRPGRTDERTARRFGDLEINTRIAQYEMAFRMQTSAPGLTDLSGEPKSVIEEYGIDNDGVDGGFARNCLLARRMVERGVRFVQLMHRGCDQHGDLPKQIRCQCRDVYRPSAALVRHLKHRGLLDDTLVIWGASSAGPSTARGPWRLSTTGATITAGVSRPGWPGEGSGRGSPTARPTTSATTSSRTPSTSTTSTPPSSAAWESTTPG